MANDSAREYVFTSEVEAFKDEQKLLVWKWKGEDALSRGYCFCIDLAQPIDDPTHCMPLLGERATFANNAQGFRWHGIVTSLQQLNEDAQYRYIQVLLEPQWSIARLDHTSRVHASETPDILLSHLVKFTLERCGFKPEDPNSASNATDFGVYQWLVNKDHENRFKTDFACQYDETSYAFLSRHLEHAGIHYEFDHTGKREKMVFRSDKDQSTADKIKLNWRPAENKTLSTSGDTVWSVTRNAALAYETTGLLGYRPENTGLNLRTSADTLRERYLSRSSLKGRQVLHGERYTEQSQGKYIAELRAKQVHCARFRLSATGCSPRLRPGQLVELVDYPKSLLAGTEIDALNTHAITRNVEVRVIETQHSGQQPLPQKVGDDAEKNYVETRWTAIPAAIPFVPEVVTPVPRIAGLVTAVVESSEGTYRPHDASAPDQPGDKTMPDATRQRDYPYLNKNGQYRIRFHFAENEQDWQHFPQEAPTTTIAKETFPDQASAAPRVPRNSGWVRMATPYAGASGAKNGEFGMYFPLNEGAEVLVSFLNGDPDRPVIIGAVPNSDNLSMVQGDNEAQADDGTPTVKDPAAKKTEIPDKIAGILTQGGNMLAFNMEHQKQTIAICSPVANSYMVLGGDGTQKDAQGIVLHSESHIVTKAKSKVEDIDGKGLRRIYDLLPDAPTAKPDEKSERTAEIYKNSKKFTSLLASGEAGIALNKPKLSANLTTGMSAGVSANLSLDLAVKLGASFTGVFAVDWNIGFSAKIDVNFFEHKRTKKAEKITTRKRSALILDDELKAGKRTEQILRKETYTASTYQYSDTVFRSETGQAIVLSVCKPRTSKAPQTDTFADAVAVKSLSQMFKPKLISPFEEIAPVLSLDKLTKDNGKIESDALSSLQLTKLSAELIGERSIYLSTTDTNSTIALSTGKTGSVALTRDTSSVGLNGAGFHAKSATAGLVKATTDLTLQAGNALYIKSSANASLKSSGLVSLTAGSLIKLG